MSQLNRSTRTQPLKSGHLNKGAHISRGSTTTECAVCTEASLPDIHDSSQKEGVPQEMITTKRLKSKYTLEGRDTYVAGGKEAHLNARCTL